MKNLPTLFSFHFHSFTHTHTHTHTYNPRRSPGSRLWSGRMNAKFLRRKFRSASMFLCTIPPSLLGKLLLPIPQLPPQAYDKCGFLTAINFLQHFLLPPYISGLSVLLFLGLPGWPLSRHGRFRRKCVNRKQCVLSCGGVLYRPGCPGLQKFGERGWLSAECLE